MARSLAHLTTVSVERVRGLSGKRGQTLAKQGVGSVADLLLHVPRRYLDRSTKVLISEVPLGEEVTLIGTVERVSSRRPRRGLVIVEATIRDESASMKATWFNQAFRAQQLSEGQEVALSGKVDTFRGKLQMKSPAVDVLRGSKEALTTGRVVPVHPSVGDVGPGWMRRAIHNALERSQPVPDPLPSAIVDRHALLPRHRALADIHFPERMEDVAPARRRLVFDEFFRLEVALALQKQMRRDTEHGIGHEVPGVLARRFINGLPFPLTGAQQRAIEVIDEDLTAREPMHRLLQGEVGSGKTVVAVAMLLRAVEGGYQGAVMAPTEVLATQHYLGIAGLLARAGLEPTLEGDGAALGMESLFAIDGPAVSVALLTSSACEVNFLGPGSANRNDVLAWISEGRIDVVVGTHALIQEGVHFAGLGAAVVDEQHRFGVHQRVELKEKAAGYDPDLLIMTATPIPRTLSMTLYGDLDVTVLDEMPPGRTPVVTFAEPVFSRAEKLIRDAVSEGRQAFVVCPLVEDSDKVEAASAVAEFERLSVVFEDLRVGLLHGQMHSRDKAAVMEAMREGEIDVLVATTVIEVGIDIPNATIMAIQDADRFGLSQLHQLRGRVGRGQHGGVCVLVSDPSTEEGAARIAAMVETTDGFRLAEEDLRIRGQGTIFGARQSGLADLRIADLLEDLDELVAARREAFAMVANDPHLDDHSEVRDEVAALLPDSVEWLFIS